MRLSEIRDKLVDLKIESHRLETNNMQGNAQLQFAKLSAWKAYIARVEEIPGTPTSEIREQFAALLENRSENLVVPIGEATTLLTRFHALQSGLIMLRDILSRLLPTAGESDVSIKLPDSTDYGVILADETTLFERLNPILLQAPFNTSMQIKGWEQGSLWMQVCVGGPLAVAMLGALCWAAAVVRKKWKEGDLIETFVAGRKVKVETLQDLRESIKHERVALIEAEAKAIHDKHFNHEGGPETIERIKLTIKSLMEMINRGAEIHPALMQPEKADNLFPNFKALDTVASRILRIEDGEKE